MLQGNLQDDCKEQALDVGPKAIHQLNFRGYIDCDGGLLLNYCSWSFKKLKETILDFSQVTKKVLEPRCANLFCIGIEWLDITV